jgi:hypothetical protein
MTFFVFWVVSGLFGSFLIWNDMRIETNFPWCPTPRAIAVSIIASAGGLVVLLFGVAFAVIGFILIRLPHTVSETH